MHITQYIAFPKKTLLLSIVLGMIAGLSHMGILAVLNKLIVGNENITLFTASVFFIFLIFAFVSESSAQILFYRLSQNILYNLQNTICRKILQTSLHQIEKIGINKIYAVLTQDIQTLSMTALLLPALLINLILTIGCLIYLFIISPLICIYVLLFIFINSFLLVMFDIKFFRKKLDLARQNIDDLFVGYDGILRGIKELKLHERKQESFFQEKIVTPTNQYRKLILQSLGFYAIAKNSWKTSFYILLGIILLFSFRANYGNILSQVCIIIIYLISPISTIIDTYPNMLRAITAFKKIKSVDLQTDAMSFPRKWESMQMDPHLHENDKKRKKMIEDINKNEIDKSFKKNHWEKINLKQITYTYITQKTNQFFKLGPIDMTLQPGKIFFLTGKNGAGKSTLIKLITGLYLPDTGSIDIDNECMIHSIAHYRENFSVIFSDYYLFEKLYGIDVNDNHVNNYLNKLELSDSVSVKNNMFSTIKLSDGQRKRLALLTAYLEDRNIYVFDEWASNQDPMFKDAFYTQFIIELKKKNKCVIVISHDKEYFHMADQLYEIKNGKLLLIKDTPLPVIPASLAIPASLVIPAKAGIQADGSPLSRG